VWWDRCSSGDGRVALQGSVLQSDQLTPGMQEPHWVTGMAAHVSLCPGQACRLLGVLDPRRAMFMPASQQAQPCSHTQLKRWNRASSVS